jgi:hypothetical protein
MYGVDMSTIEADERGRKNEDRYCGGAILVVI